MAADLRGHCIYSACVTEAPLGGIYAFEKQSLKVLTQVMSFTPLSQIKGKMFDILERIILTLPQNLCSILAVRELPITLLFSLLSARSSHHSEEITQ